MTQLCLEAASEGAPLPHPSNYSKLKLKFKTTDGVSELSALSLRPSTIWHTVPVFKLPEVVDVQHIHCVERFGSLDHADQLMLWCGDRLLFSQTTHEQQQV